MTVEELKVRFTASTEDFKAKTDEMKQKLSSVQSVSDNMQKTIDRGMKSASEKTQKLAKNLSSVVQKMNDQSEKLKDAAESVDFYADQMDRLKAKSQAQTAAIEAQKAKVEELKNKYSTVSDVAGKFGSKIPLQQQFEEAEKQANLLEEKIREVQKNIDSASSDQDLVFVDDELMSLDKAKEKMAQLISEQEAASQKAGEIEDAMAQIGKEDASAEGMKKMKAEVAAAERELQKLEKEANKTNAGIQSTATKAANSYKKMEAASKTFDRLKAQAGGMQAQLKKATTLTKRFKEKLESIRDGPVRKVTNAFKKASSGISSAISKVKSLGSHAKSSAGQLSKIPSALKKIALAAVGIKLIKSIFGRLRSVVSDYISRNEELNSKVEGLKKAFGQILAPAIETIVSMFEKLIPYILGVANAIMEVLSSLSVFSGLKKTSQSIDGVTDSAKELSKAQKELYGFDIITKQSDDKELEKDSTTPTYKPAEIGSLEEIISKMTAAINKAMASIDWEAIQKKAVDFASKVSAAFNQFFNEIDWELAGKTVGEGLNTISLALNTFLKDTDFGLIGESLGTALSSGIKTIDWKLMGENITLGLSSIGKTVQGFAEKMDWSAVADAINRLFDGINLDTATTELAKGINETVSGLRTTFQNINWVKIGKTFADGINGIFKIDWGEVGGLLSDGIDGIWDALNTAIQNIEWKNLGSSIADLIQGIKWDELLGNLGTTIGSSLTGILDTVSGFLQKMDWSQAVNDLWNGLVNFVKGFNFSGVISSLSETVGSVIGAAFSIGASLLGKVKELVLGIKDAIVDYFKQYVKWDDDATLLENGKNLISGIFNGIVDALKNIGTWIKEKIFHPFIDGFKKAFGIASPSKEMEPMGGYIIDGLKNGLGDIWEKVKGKFSDLLTGIKNWFSEKKTEIQEAWSTATKGIGTVVATVKENYVEFKENLKTKWSTAVSGISDKTASVKEGYEAFKDGLKKKWSTAVSGISDKTAKVKENYAALKESLKTKWDKATSKISDKTAYLKTAVSDSVNKKKETVSQWWTNVKSKITPATAKANTQVTDKDNKLKNLSSIWNGLKDKAKKTITAVGSASDKDGKMKSLSSLWSKFKDKAKKAVSVTGNATDKGGNVGALWGLWGSIKSKAATLTGNAVDKGSNVGSLFCLWGSIKSKTETLTATLNDKLTNSFKTIIRNVIDLMNSMIDKVNKVLPQKYEISHVEYPAWAMAKGGIVDSPTYALIGEAGKEAVMPLENNTGWIDELARRISLNIGSGNAPSGAESKTPVIISLNIGTRKVTDILIDDINQRTQTTGRCPIRI